ncbi:MAG: DUF1801 domain-containing protein [Acidobacteria bacterium]|nr:DUF1801 domain-containing protein [Acidobacteriota bacterium]
MKNAKPPSEELIRFLSVYDLSVGELALKLREMVLSEAPTANELIYDAYNAVAIAFTFTERLKEAFCHIAVYSKHVNLGFNYGATLSDPDGMLIGSGKQVRHLKVSSPEELRNLHLRRFIQLAIEQADVQERAKSTKTIVKVTQGKKRRPH